MSSDESWQKKVTKLGICIKDSSFKVLYQNEICTQVCGDKVCQICEKNCRKFYQSAPAFPALSEGVQLFKNKPIDRSHYDIVVINNRDQVVTILYGLDEKYEEETEFLKTCGLSEREMDVMLLIMRGASNVDVAQKLSISKATLKTHLNNIYKKLPEDIRQEFKNRALRKDRF